MLRAIAVEAIAARDEERAETQLHAALSLARAQGSLAWELRAAMSLARLWRRDRQAAAHDLLAEVYGRFTEGHTTSDLLAAKALLRQLASA